MLFSLAPFCLEHAYNVRMYSLASAFVFLNGVCAYRLYNEEKKSFWLGYVIGGVGAAYTHYFAFVSICVIYTLFLLAIILNKKYLFKSWVAAFGVSTILYLPWKN